MSLIFEIILLYKCLCYCFEYRLNDLIDICENNMVGYKIEKTYKLIRVTDNKGFNKFDKLVKKRLLRNVNCIKGESFSIYQIAGGAGFNANTKLKWIDENGEYDDDW